MDILLPVGRMVGGSMYEPKFKFEDDGKTPRMDAKTGQQMRSYDFALAIKKTQAAWTQEPWGAQVYSVGLAAYKDFVANPAFAWKITDGDSRIPNQNNKIPGDNPNYAGCWIVWFSQQFAIRLVNKTGTMDLVRPCDIRSDQNPSGMIVNQTSQEVGEILPGYFIEVMANVVGNKPAANGKSKPGLFWNPNAVALSGFGPVIEAAKADTKTMGFGAAALPAGASSVPVSALPNAPAASSAPAAPMAPPPAPVAPPVVTPNPAILHVPQRVMQPSANGATYESLIAGGWTDALLLQHGHMKMV